MTKKFPSIMTGNVSEQNAATKKKPKPKPKPQPKIRKGK